jgi:ribosomal protein L30/L7E
MPKQLGLKIITPPEVPVYRIASALDAVDPISTPSALGRFDLGGNIIERPQERIFLLLACATHTEAAFGEAIAAFRPSIEAIARASANNLALSSPKARIIPEQWLRQHRLVVTKLDASLSFVDLEDPQTIEVLRSSPDIAKVATSMGLHDIDHAVLISNNREFTQRIALFIHEQHDESGQPLFAGLRYSSRLNPSWECWALFNDRISPLSSSPVRINPSNKHLREAARLLNLRLAGAADVSEDAEEALILANTVTSVRSPSVIPIPIVRPEEASTAKPRERGSQEQPDISDEDIFAALVDYDPKLHLSPLRETKIRVRINGIEKGKPKIVLPEGLEDLE